MTPIRRSLVIGVAILTVAAATSGTAATAAGDHGNAGMTGEQAARATAAALDATGGGVVNAVERDAENGATWEVEVTSPDGPTVDVRLDAGYSVVVIERDGRTAGDAGDTAP